VVIEWGMHRAYRIVRHRVSSNARWSDMVRECGCDRPGGKQFCSNERSLREWIRTSLCRVVTWRSRTSENNSLVARTVRSKVSILKSGSRESRGIADSILTARSVGCETAEFLVPSRTNLTHLVRRIVCFQWRTEPDEGGGVAASSSEDSVSSRLFPSCLSNLRIDLMRSVLSLLEADNERIPQPEFERVELVTAGIQGECASRPVTRDDFVAEILLLARGKFGEDQR
jgi:hypothetical protein